MQLDGEVEAFLEPYIATNKGDLRVLLTYAQSIDGRISAGHGLRTKLSGSESHCMTHYLRSRHDAILVGVNTAIFDDPKLNCRYENNQKQPRPIVLDSSFQWDLSAKQWSIIEVSRAGNGLPPWVFATETATQLVGFESRKDALTAIGGELIVLKSLEWPVISDYLVSRSIHSLMIEGGAKVIETAISSKIADSIIITIAPRYLGASGIQATTDCGVDLTNSAWRCLGEDMILCANL